MEVTTSSYVIVILLIILATYGLIVLINKVLKIVTRAILKIKEKNKNKK